ncbi:serine hydrolase [Rubellicoccus peritrichatus]|uniref:Serine hydrolase n=1 Tax=Rubellicoccus peritrichatus TaxID=3080537 RepID=A0AAQ3LC56_9BACT|nr:serine hydrolase [Puniceicoccus sp. CR14]WOO40798.1 serine hydrolase [Puniceicoccus sp. CR14]
MLRLGHSLILLIASLASSTTALAQSTNEYLVQEFAELAALYGEPLVEEGQAVGVAIGITWNGQRFFYQYGVSDSSGNAFTTDTIFEIGSVTKVLTTAGFGRQVAEGSLALGTPASDYAQIITSLEPSMAPLSLLELGVMNSGLPSTPTLCSNDNVPGCAPNSRPTIQEYTAPDLITFLENTTPMNFNVSPPTATTLPAPYFYSDISIGILGLLLPYQFNEGFSSDPIDDYWTYLSNTVLTPIGMSDTYLFVPSDPGVPVAEGFDLAFATETIDQTTGAIEALTPVSVSSGYVNTPTVTITGGGGTGAEYTAVLTDGGVTGYTKVNGGSGYHATAAMTFSGGNPTTAATGTVIVKDGSVVGLGITSGGAGYTSAPTVTIVQGGGIGATAQAFIEGGEVVHLELTNPGSGFVEPLSIKVSLPDTPATNVIPIWAPAGAVSSTIADMVSFAEVGLGHTIVNDMVVPPTLTQGLSIAQTPYFSGAGTSFAGLAWNVAPPVESVGIPQVVSKDGGLSGFSTQLTLMPDLDFALVVFVNTRDANTFTNTGPTRPAEAIGANITRAVALSPELAYLQPIALNPDGESSLVPWLGNVYLSEYPWIYHEQLQWVYPGGEGSQTNSYWFFLDTLKMGWVWTQDNAFPFIWSNDLNAWLYYDTATASPWYFFNTNTNEWFAVN